MSLAGVGPPIWSLITFKDLFDFDNLIIVFTKLLPYFEKQSPYVVGLIKLDGYSNIRIIGRIMRADNTNEVEVDKITIGSKLSVGFNKINTDISIPFWYLES